MHWLVGGVSDALDPGVAVAVTVMTHLIKYLHMVQCADVASPLLAGAWCSQRDDLCGAAAPAGRGRRLCVGDGAALQGGLQARAAHLSVSLTRAGLQVPPHEDPLWHRPTSRHSSGQQGETTCRVQGFALEVSEGDRCEAIARRACHEICLHLLQIRRSTTSQWHACVGEWGGEW